MIRTLTLLSLVVFFGCGSNHRYYFRQNVELIGRVNRDNASYSVITIGTPEIPFDKNLNQYGQVAVGLPGNRLIPLSELTVAILNESCLKLTNLDEVDYETRWPRGSQRITVQPGMHFVVHGNRILCLSASSVVLRGNEEPPRFCIKDCQHLFALPFSEQQIFKLFGKPEKLNSMWHN